MHIMPGLNRWVKWITWQISKRGFVCRSTRNNPAGTTDQPKNLVQKDPGLSWKNLMDESSLQNAAGVLTASCEYYRKKLSPRKIMMDTRDRMEEIGRELTSMANLRMMAKRVTDYITVEELRDVQP